MIQEKTKNSNFSRGENWWFATTEYFLFLKGQKYVSDLRKKKKKYTDLYCFVQSRKSQTFILFWSDTTDLLLERKWFSTVDSIRRRQRQLFFSAQQKIHKQNSWLSCRFLRWSNGGSRWLILRPPLLRPSHLDLSREKKSTGCLPDVGKRNHVHGF